MEDNIKLKSDFWLHKTRHSIFISPKEIKLYDSLVDVQIFILLISDMDRIYSNMYSKSWLKENIEEKIAMIFEKFQSELNLK